MYPPTIAEQLRLRGHDVVAVTESSELRSLPDAAVFAAAQREHRAVATENVADFIPLANEPDQRGESHFGLVLVDSSRFSPGVSLKNDPRIPPNTPPPAATNPNAAIPRPPQTHASLPRTRDLRRRRHPFTTPASGRQQPTAPGRRRARQNRCDARLGRHAATLEWKSRARIGLSSRLFQSCRQG